MIKQRKNLNKHSMLNYAMLFALDLEKKQDTVDIIKNFEDNDEGLENVLDLFEDLLSLCKVDYTFKTMDYITFSYKLNRDNLIYSFKKQINFSSKFIDGLKKRGFVYLNTYETVEDEPEKFQLIVRVSYEKLGLKKPKSEYETDNRMFAQMRDNIINPILEIYLNH